MELLADFLWQRTGQTSLEHCRVSRLQADGFLIQGVVLAHTGSAPRQIHYMVLCGLDWVTRSVHVTAIEGPDVRAVQLERDRHGNWRRDSERVPEFDGLTDVDLQVTPATNTLPIRRLQLALGDSAETDALWLRFPELSLERLPQRYTRTAEFRYAYESGAGAFRADLEVDADGLVIRYGDLWRRL